MSFHSGPLILPHKKNILQFPFPGTTERVPQLISAKKPVERMHGKNKIDDIAQNCHKQKKSFLLDPITMDEVNGTFFLFSGF